MSPRAKELWSYLIGLGPVGETVHVNPQWLSEDLGIHTRAHRGGLISRLIREGVIRRIGWDVVIVLKRIPPEKGWEDRLKKKPEVVRVTTPSGETMSLHKAEQLRRGREGVERKRQEFIRAITSVPEDDRDLTARIFGDPISCRSALYQKRMQASA